MGQTLLMEKEKIVSPDSFVTFTPSIEFPLKTEFFKHTIQLKFFGECFVVERATGKIFYSGDELYSQRNYLGARLEKNNEFRKKRLTVKFHEGFAFVINRGIDGRLFFLLFTADNYKKYKGEPFWQGSFWLHENTAEWFENNLNQSCRLWQIK